MNHSRSINNCYQPPLIEENESSVLQIGVNSGKPVTPRRTGLLPTKLVSARRARSSIVPCKERYACRGSQSVAYYRCDQCESYQCEACKTLLHEKADFLFHQPTLIPIPAAQSLCDGPECAAKNFADITCENCNKNYCYNCDTVIHSPKNKTSNKSAHSRVPYEEPTSDNCAELDDMFNEFISFQDNFEDCVTDDVQYFMNQKPSRNLNLLEDDMSSVEFNSSDSALEPFCETVKGAESFLFANEEEAIQVESIDEFVRKLRCSVTDAVKVVSIFGNTGEGKSHTLNHVFFGGGDVFKTSPTQESCTIGVWVAYNPDLKVIAVDTEGLLGVTNNSNQRTRLLLKVMAISDIVIYRTCAKRLHNDLFSFFSDASRAYTSHFKQELEDAAKRCSQDNFKPNISLLGPAVIVFHETQHTDILKPERGRVPEDELKERFAVLGCSIEAFGAIEYVGVRTKNPPTSFRKLCECVKRRLLDCTVRSPRSPIVIFEMFKVLNEKFSGQIERSIPSAFPDEYFTCTAVCLSCNGRCTRTVNHIKDGLDHSLNTLCSYQHQYDNKVYICKKCRNDSRHNIVLPKPYSNRDNAWFGYVKCAWSGYILECPYCGIIYRSREHWYGNRDPEEQVAITETIHVWADCLNASGNDPQNSAQKILDTVNYVSTSVSSVSAGPTKLLTGWVMDKVRPTYWMQNSEITHCSRCERSFEENVNENKHHCRACGRGFCGDCSSKTKPVPERGWGPAPVRVCDECYNKSNAGEVQSEEDVTARKVGEVVQGAFGTVGVALDYSLGFLKDSARPVYWKPDKDIKNCSGCKREFGPKLGLHHCRACGDGVCEGCSPEAVPVPSKGWDYPVRVCVECAKKPRPL